MTQRKLRKISKIRSARQAVERHEKLESFWSYETQLTQQTVIYIAEILEKILSEQRSIKGKAVDKESKRIIFKLLDIIHEQSEVIMGLLVKIGLTEQSDFYHEAMERHQRTRNKFLQMGANLGWSPEVVDEGNEAD